MQDFNLFNKWATKVPKYDQKFSEILFDTLSKKGGGSDKEQKFLGKHFNTNYELYIYCFFLGLYNNEKIDIPPDVKKVDFSHAIQHWGSKGNRNDRKDFTVLQESIFIACLAKTDLELIELEKGNIDIEQVIASLIKTLESYTNGGLTILKEELERNNNFGLLDEAFLDLIFDKELA